MTTDDGSAIKKHIQMTINKLLTIAVVTAALIVPANAEEYPLREPGAGRTAFMEAGNKTCQKNALPDRLRSKVTMTQFCDCYLDAVATMTTMSYLEKSIQGGVFTPSPEVLALARDANTLCMIVLRNGAPSK